MFIEFVIFKYGNLEYKQYLNDYSQTIKIEAKGGNAVNRGSANGVLWKSSNFIDSNSLE